MKIKRFTSINGIKKIILRLTVSLFEEKRLLFAIESVPDSSIVAPEFLFVFIEWLSEFFHIVRPLRSEIMI